jgi:hypothetical protein
MITARPCAPPPAYQVAVKVQRPNVFEGAALDIFIVRRAALIFSKLPMVGAGCLGAGRWLRGSWLPGSWGLGAGCLGAGGGG